MQRSNDGTYTHTHSLFIDFLSVAYLNDIPQQLNGQKDVLQGRADQTSALQQSHDAALAQVTLECCVILNWVLWFVWRICS